MEEDRREVLEDLYKKQTKDEDMRADEDVIKSLIDGGYIYDWSKHSHGLYVYGLTKKGTAYVDGYYKGQADAKVGSHRPKNKYDSSVIEALMYGEECTFPQLKEKANGAEDVVDTILLMQDNGLITSTYLGMKEGYLYKSTAILNEYCEGYAEGRR